MDTFEGIEICLRIKTIATLQSYHDQAKKPEACVNDQYRSLAEIKNRKIMMKKHLDSNW